MKLDEFIGQSDIVGSLKMEIRAVARRSECLDHLLIHGAAGMGKTTLAEAIAHELGSEIKTLSPTANVSELTDVLTKIDGGDILLIENVDRMRIEAQAVLVQAMRGNFPLTIGKGKHERVITIELPEFTFIGTTSNVKSVSTNVWSKVCRSIYLSEYSNEEICEILKSKAEDLSVDIHKSGTSKLVALSCNNPAIGDYLLRAAAVYIEVVGLGVIDGEAVENMLQV
jgi:Holliday junction DNA helicase RuvB